MQELPEGAEIIYTPRRAPSAAPANMQPEDAEEMLAELPADAVVEEEPALPLAPPASMPMDVAPAAPEQPVDPAVEALPEGATITKDTARMPIKEFSNFITGRARQGASFDELRSAAKENGYALTPQLEGVLNKMYQAGRADYVPEVKNAHEAPAPTMRKNTGVATVTVPELKGLGGEVSALLHRRAPWKEVTGLVKERFAQAGLEPTPDQIKALYAGWSRLQKSPKMAVKAAIHTGLIEKRDTPYAVSEVSKIPGVDTVAAGARGASDIITFNFGDELMAALKAAPAIVDPNKKFSEEYEKNWLVGDAQRTYDEQEHSTARMVGQGVGLVTQAALIPGVGMNPQSSLLTNTVKSAGLGATIGGLDATGAGSPDDRFEHTMDGVAIGGVVGGAIPGAMRVGGRVTRPVSERVANIALPGDESSLRALARRVGMDPQEMQMRANRIRDLGGEPTLFDVMDEGAQDMVGVAARKIENRDKFQQFADERVENLPDRVGVQARRLSADMRTPDEMVAQIEDSRNLGMKSEMDIVRAQGQQVPVSEEMFQALSTPEVVTAMQAAKRLEANPENRAKYDMVLQALRDYANMPPARLGGDVDAHIARVRGLREAVKLDIDMADKISRSLYDAAESASRSGGTGKANVLRNFAGLIRGQARTVPDDVMQATLDGPNNLVPVAGSSRYDRALTQYGEDTGAAQAVRLGEDVLKRNTDEFVAGASALSDEPTRVLRPMPERTPQGTMHGADHTTRVSGSDINAAAPSYAEDVAPYIENGFSPSSMILNGQATEAQVGRYLTDPNIPADKIEGVIDDLRTIGGYTDDEIDGMVKSAMNGAEATPPRAKPEFTRKEGGTDFEYVLPNGENVVGSFSVQPGGNVANVTIQGYDAATAANRANQFGPGVVRDLMAQLKKAYPEVEFVQGSRVTGAKANGGSPVQVIDLRPKASAGPSPRDLARAGARRAVERSAGETPRGAYATADRIAKAPEVKKRINSLIGPEATQEMAAAMAMETKAVRDAVLRAPRTGSRTAVNQSDDTFDASSFVNVMYNPTSPVAWVREAVRMLTRVGMSDKDARFIVDMATDPRKTDEMISQIQKRVGDSKTAETMTRLIRGGAVRISNSGE